MVSYFRFMSIKHHTNFRNIWCIVLKKPWLLSLLVFCSLNYSRYTCIGSQVCRMCRMCRYRIEFSSLPFFPALHSSVPFIHSSFINPLRLRIKKPLSDACKISFDAIYEWFFVPLVLFSLVPILILCINADFL